MTKRAADLVFKNGRIYTMNRAQPWVSEIAVLRGRIVAVGSAEGLTGPDTRVVDLRGAMMMPGIVDDHTHMMMGGQAELFELRFQSIATVDTILQRVAETAAKTPAGRWI